MEYNYQGSMKEIMANIEHVKKNPVLIQRAIIDYLEEVTNNEIQIVDITNPFVLLLEASAVNTATAINHSNINLRKQYASLALTDEDIYRHMSDKEIMNRYASPSEAEFVFMLSLEDLRKHMVFVTGDYYYKITIPKDSYIKIDDVEYTLSYPIDIKQYTTGGVAVSYDTSLSSPIENVSTININPLVRSLPDGNTLLYFTVRLKQLKVNSHNFTIEQKAIFKKTIRFTDSFYYARAYHKGSVTSNEWKELTTTHTDQVYDLLSPTVCFRVYTDTLEVYVPHVYITNGLIGSSLRIDIHTTKGKLSVNYADDLTENFSITLRNLTDTDDTVYSKACANVNLRVISSDINTSGENAIPFSKLRERVIYHANGEMDIPITNVQNKTKLNNKGFDVVTNIDVVTNRTMLATRRLPAPINKRLLTPINTATITTVLDSKTFIGNPFIRVNNETNRITILPKNLYINNNGIVQFVGYSEALAIRSLPVKERINHINSKSYLYTPYYYCLDHSEAEFSVRAYDLDHPKNDEINFIFQNDSMQLAVHTDNFYFLKTDSGYEIIIKTKSGNFYKQASDQEVGLQIAFYPRDETTLAYINAELVVTNPDDGERVWRAVLETNYDIDNTDCLHITNAKIYTDSDKVLAMPLDSTIYLFHHSTSISTVYRTDDYTSKLGYFIIDPSSKLITYESINVKLGYALHNLWKRAKTVPVAQDYLRYDVDIPLVYDRDIYRTDSTGIVFNIVGGNIEYEIMYRKGDTVLDNEGEPIYKHRAGDIYLDEHGKPVTDGEVRKVYEVDIFYIDGNVSFITDSAMLSYKEEIVTTVTNWITEDIKEIEANLLERTNIYYYPQSTLGTVDVVVENGSEITLPAQQSFILKLYVNKAVYSNDNVRENIRRNTIEIIDSHLRTEEVNMSSISSDLKTVYGNSVISFDISGLGGSKNLTLARVKNPENRLCINKKAASQPDDSVLIEDDVTISFVLFD